jgi:predicted nucleotidyltransferase
VKYLYAFGSSITSEFNEHTSDIDLVVEVDEKDPAARGEYLLSLWDQIRVFFSSQSGFINGVFHSESLFAEAD